MGISIYGYVSCIGKVEYRYSDDFSLDQMRKLTDDSPVSCPDADKSKEMEKEISDARKKKDTLGGSITTIATGVPPTLGSYVHWDKKLDAKLARILMSIQSVKAIEVGDGIESSKNYGTSVQDQYVLNEKEIKKESNNLGGFEGGMTNGENIELTAYLKPISTTLTPIKSVNLVEKEETETVYERSDTCAVPRAVPIFESAMALEILNAVLNKTGGDNKKEIIKNFENIPSLNIDEFAPRFSFFFNAHNDFFEEIAKYRAARRIWANDMKYKYGAKDPRSWKLRFHCQTAGCSLTAQQPEINIVRVAIQAMAGVLGGTQSLHTDSMDEALALPSEKAVQIALRTQQVIAHESGVANVIDPLGGSYYLEWLTEDMERQARDYFDRIDSLGGVVPAIEKGFFQKEIAAASYKYQKEIDDKERVVVGVNEYTSDESVEIPILEMDPEGFDRQCARLKKLRANRDKSKFDSSIRAIEKAAEGDENLMPHFIEASKAGVTLGEMCDVLRGIFGEYREGSDF